MTPRGELKQLRDELKAQVPQPIHSMLRDKESIADAKEKFLPSLIVLLSDAELTQLQNSAANGNNVEKVQEKHQPVRNVTSPEKGIVKDSVLLHQ